MSWTVIRGKRLLREKQAVPFCHRFVGFPRYSVVNGSCTLHILIGAVYLELVAAQAVAFTKDTKVLVNIFF